MRSRSRSAVRRISPAPGRKTSSDPLRCAARARPHRVTCLRSARVGIAPEIARLDWKGAPCALDYRRVAEERRNPRAVERRRHHEQPEIVAQARCASSASARPRSASSERSWNSSNSTAVTSVERGIVEDHTGEHAFGDDLDPGFRRDFGLDAHAIADRVADAARRASTPCARPRRGRRAGAARAENFPVRPWLVEQHQRHPRGLAGAGRRDQTTTPLRASASVSCGSATSIGRDVSKVRMIFVVIIRSAG